MNIEDIQLVPKAPVDVDETISREDWKFPLLAQFKNWLLGFGAAALLILVVLYGAYLYMRPVPVVDTKPAIAVAGNPATPPVKQISAKAATKKQVEQPINTPAIAEFIPVITPSATPAELLTPAQQDFENRRAIFEGKTP